MRYQRALAETNHKTRVVQRLEEEKMVTHSNNSQELMLFQYVPRAAILRESRRTAEARKRHTRGSRQSETIHMTLIFYSL